MTTQWVICWIWRIGGDQWSLPMHSIDDSSQNNAGAAISRPKNERRMMMDFYKVPIGFGMALAMNQPAMNAYAAMTEEEKQAVVNKAHNVRSEKEMHDLVASLAGGRMG